MISRVRICIPKSVDIALDINRYDFAVKVDFEDGRPVAHIEKPRLKWKGGEPFSVPRLFGNRVSLLASGPHRRKLPHFGGSASNTPASPIICSAQGNSMSKYCVTMR